MNIHGFTLQQTSKSSPEAYDIFSGEKYVARFRLRHGVFTVWVPDLEDPIYVGYPDGDTCFLEHERDQFLKHGINRLIDYLRFTSDL